jgi:hypothetical protein
MSAKSEKVKVSTRQNDFQQQIAKVIFPRNCGNQDLPVDKNLKPIRLIFTKRNVISSKGILKIPFELLVSNATVDAFLYVNGNKSDMYYSIPSGKYSFNCYIEKRINNVELFYISNGCKSPSVYETLVRK